MTEMYEMDEMNDMDWIPVISREEAEKMKDIPRCSMEDLARFINEMLDGIPETEDYPPMQLVEHDGVCEVIFDEDPAEGDGGETDDELSV